MSINAGRRALRLSLSSLLLVLGCEGGDGSDSSGSAGEAQGSGSASGANPGVGGSGAGASSALESSGSRRLTRAEFAASVRALLGADAPIDATLLPLDASAPFDNFAANQLASLSLVEAV